MVKTKARLGFEQLERRDLLALGEPDWTAGVLTITSDSASDSIEVRSVPVAGVQCVRVWLGGAVHWTGQPGAGASADLRQVVVHCNGGNDTVNLSAITNALSSPFTSLKNDPPDCASSVFGGEGADSFVGSSFNDDFEGGNGNDTASGAAGADLLYGGSGNDSLHGGGGSDTLYGDNAAPSSLPATLAASVGGSDRMYGNHVGIKWTCISSTVP